MPRSDRRENFRIVYPHHVCPAFVWRGETARVIDCSEHGFRVEIQCYSDVPARDARVHGRIVFLDGTAVEVFGVVRHVRGRVVGVNFEAPGVPWRVVLREQVCLRTGGPEWAASA